MLAGLAHLWFVTIHPFDDGNGRIARAIADLHLARSEGSSQRFYSMSAQIRRERREYYDMLARTQKGGMDVTPWMAWFLACLGRAIQSAQTTLAPVLAKAQVWESLADVPLNERQRVIMRHLTEGFEGKLTTVKWAKLAKCSHDTALRDIQDLVARGFGAEPGRGPGRLFACRLTWASVRNRPDHSEAARLLSSRSSAATLFSVPSLNSVTRHSHFTIGAPPHQRRRNCVRPRLRSDTTALVLRSFIRAVIHQRL